MIYSCTYMATVGVKKFKCTVRYFLWTTLPVRFILKRSRQLSGRTGRGCSTVMAGVWLAERLMLIAAAWRRHTESTAAAADAAARLRRQDQKDTSLPCWTPARPGVTLPSVWHCHVFESAAAGVRSLAVASLHC